MMCRVCGLNVPEPGLEALLKHERTHGPEKLREAYGMRCLGDFS